MTARVACVCAPDLGLQVLLRDRPAWRGAPVALVAEDRPDAPLAVLNAHALRQGLHPGVRHGVARSLVPALRTAVVPAARVGEAARAIVEALRALSPRVELDDAPGVFLVDASGMGRLHRDVRAWALAARRAVAAQGFSASVCVGFDRRTVRAVALCARGVVVPRSLHEELAHAGAVPLAALGLSARALAALDALGLTTLAALWALPVETVRHRFGPEVAALRAWAEREPTLPVQPDVPREPARTVIEVEPPDDDLARLLFAVRGALLLLVGQLASRGEAACALRLDLTLEDRGRVAHRVEPAAPTRDVALLVDLTRLRLTEGGLTARVREVEVTVEPAALRGEQMSLFAHDRARDPAAVTRAVARVRAAFGAASVTRARLREAHLPEASFAWEALDLDAVPALAAASGDSAPAAVPLIRRLLTPPREVSPAELRALSPITPDAALLPWLRGDADNDTTRDGPRDADPWAKAAPSRVRGAWWARTVERDYYYAEARDGALWWVYFDRVRGRWFLHGIVD